MRYRPPAEIIAKNKERGWVCLGGLGHLGVGTMWVKEEPDHKDRPGYATAPEVEIGDDETLSPSCGGFTLPSNSIEWKQ